MDGSGCARGGRGRGSREHGSEAGRPGQRQADGERPSLGDPIAAAARQRRLRRRALPIEIDYDPVANRFDAATTEIVAVASQHLKELSFDFQDDLTVASVTVDGRAAKHRFEAATPVLAGATQPMKLVVVPHPSSRPKAGRSFTVRVDYSGYPQPMTDPDESIEGWVPACYPLTAPRTCDGAFVVNEPMGAQSWFPSNNHPVDKATFDTVITVPVEKTALGIGELVSRVANGDGTATWHWREDDPTATYLTTATVGDFTYTVGSMTETSTGKVLPIYNAVDASATPAQAAAIQISLDAAPAQLDFLSDWFGPFPFDSIGAVADRAAGVGYALEVQTKPHYSGGFTTGNPSINIITQVHELAHQWWGNSVTLRTWSDIWLNEGWAEWSEWFWPFSQGTGDDPAAIVDDLYASTPSASWTLAPAVLDGDPANMFANFPVRVRPAMMLQGYREIVGDDVFFDSRERSRSSTATATCPPPSSSTSPRSTRA